MRILTPIAIAVHAPSATLVATDLSPAALAVARANADRLGVTPRIDFVLADCWAPRSTIGRVAPTLIARIGSEPVASNQRDGDRRAGAASPRTATTTRSGHYELPPDAAGALRAEIRRLVIEELSQLVRG